VVTHGPFPVLSQTMHSVQVSRNIKSLQALPRFRRCRLTVAACLSPAQVFSISSAVMVPIYAMMTFLPQSKLTRTLIVYSPILPVTLSLCYTALLFQGFQTMLPYLQPILSQAPWTVSALHLGDLLSTPLVTCTAWLHLLLVDFLQARWILQDGLERSVFTAHSVALSFFVGPLGLLSHLLTRTICSKR
jgi:hypothetical protein